MAIKLLLSPGSQHSRRVSIVLHELGMEVDQEIVPYGKHGFGGDEREAFLAINPNGKVPVLVEDDMVLWESNAIMWYLAERHGETPLWPADARRRAQITMWQVWQAAHLTPAADGLFFENAVKPGFMGLESDAGQVERHTEAFHRWMRVLEGALDHGAFVTQGRFTFADISISTALMHAESARMPVSEHPRVAAWFEAVRARPSWAATEPPAMPAP